MDSSLISGSSAFHTFIIALNAKKDSYLQIVGIAHVCPHTVVEAVCFLYFL